MTEQTKEVIDQGQDILEKWVNLAQKMNQAKLAKGNRWDERSIVRELSGEPIQRGLCLYPLETALGGWGQYLIEIVPAAEMIYPSKLGPDISSSYSGTTSNSKTMEGLGSACSQGRVLEPQLSEEVCSTINITEREIPSFNPSEFKFSIWRDVENSVLNSQKPSAACANHNQFDVILVPSAIASAARHPRHSAVPMSNASPELTLGRTENSLPNSKSCTRNARLRMRQRYPMVAKVLHFLSNDVLKEVSCSCRR